MAHTNHNILFPICTLIIATVPMFGEVKMQVREGRPIVDGVFVNGHGPYRFLLDTGSNTDLIETNLAKSIGLTPSFETKLSSAAGQIPATGSDGIEVRLDTVTEGDQKFVFTGLAAIRNRWPDVQGVLGQCFLARLDYSIDLRNKRVEFGKQDRSGTRTAFQAINGRLAVHFSLGNMILDSGVDRLMLFGIRQGTGSEGEIRTVAGARTFTVVSGKRLTIEGREIRTGDAVALADRSEPGVDGLMPLSLFRSVYVCNSEGYLVFE